MGVTDRRICPDCQRKTRHRQSTRCRECHKAYRRSGALAEQERRDRDEAARPGFEVSQHADVLTISSLGFQVHTVDEAIARAEVDLRIWEVTRSTVGWYQSPVREGSRQMCAVRVWFKRKVPAFVEDAVAALVEDSAIPRVHPLRIPKRKKGATYLAELSLFDHHFGKLAWADETGEDYDVEIARGRFLGAIEDAILRADVDRIERWLLPLGQDFFNMDNALGTTTAGTPQDLDTRWPRVYQFGIAAVAQAIDRLLKVAPVQVLWVPGNHDYVTSWFLVQVMKARYRDEPRFTVDDGPDPFKYVEHGAALIGFNHGDAVKHADLPAIMATARPEAWARTKDHEWHLGHLHKKKETRWVPVDSHTGVVVRILPSLSGRGAWEHRKGFHGGRACAELYLWDRERGYVGHLAVGYVD